MNHPYACQSPEHAVSRRQMLKAMGGAIAGAGLVEPLLAAQVRERRKQMLFVWLDGAISQFETWDPKPGTQFGGPFKGIQTRLPGVRLCELMPNMAERM